MKFIIEHLEPELFEWCLIEYEHISSIVGKNNLIFTNIKSYRNKVSGELKNPRFLSNKKDADKLKKFGDVYEKNISELKFEKICVLSQYSKKTLKTEYYTTFSEYHAQINRIRY